jgi:hypothetical protein
VLVERVHEFLEWAEKLFEISVCSLGEQNYVDMVVSVLDPESKLIRGTTYSARGEYLYLSQNSGVPKAPPKDIRSLYAYAADFQIDPIILDDNEAMWVKSQQQNIIVRSFLKLILGCEREF